MAMSPYLRKKILDKVLRNTNFTVATAYLSLHTGNPGTMGVNEVSTGGYARQAITASVAVDPGVDDNSVLIDFATMPAVTVTHAGVWDALTTGNFLWGAALSPSRTVWAGHTVRIPIGALDGAIV